MDTGSDFEYDEETTNDCFVERHRQRKPHKRGKIIREEATNLRELQACPLAVSCFKHHGRFELCELVERAQFHHELLDFLWNICITMR